MNVSLKIYQLGAGWSRLSMLADYLTSKNNPHIIHLLIANAYSLNLGYLNPVNTLHVEADEHLPLRLAATLESLCAKYHVDKLFLHSEQSALFTLLRPVLSRLPKGLSKTLQLSVYDGQHADADARQQWLSLPAQTLQSLIDIEQQQLSFWLQHPDQPLINQGEQFTHLVWQRFFPTLRYCLDDALDHAPSFLAGELSGKHHSLHLQARKTLSQAEKLSLCLLMNIDKETLNALVSPRHNALHIIDNDTQAWINPLHQLEAYAATLNHQDSLMVFSNARNLTKTQAGKNVQLLPWWISPEIITFFPQVSRRLAGHEASWQVIGLTGEGLPLEWVKNDNWYFLVRDAMGDLLFFLGTLPAFRAQHRGNIVVITRDILLPIAQRSPYVDCVIPESELSTYLADINYASQQRRLFQCAGQDIISAPQHQQAAICASHSTRFEEANQQLILPRTATERSNVQAFIETHRLSNQRVVLLHPSVGAPNRSWSQHYWRELANRFLSEGWCVVVIGSNNNTNKFKVMPQWLDPRIINAIDLFSPMETIELMEYCDLLVATDTGPVALAAASSIAVCALYTIIPGNYRLPIRQGKTGWNACAINSGCHYGQCGAGFSDHDFNQWVGADHQRTITGSAFSDWCPNTDKMACLTRFTPDHFWQAIQTFLASEHYLSPADRPCYSACAPQQPDKIRRAEEGRHQAGGNLVRECQHPAAPVSEDHQSSPQ